MISCQFLESFEFPCTCLQENFVELEVGHPDDSDPDEPDDSDEFDPDDGDDRCFQ